MTKGELRELIRSVISEYTGTGDMASMGPTSDDGNNVRSQRPFFDDKQEVNFYNDQGAPYGGAEGQQTRGMEPTQPVGNPNRTRFTKF